MKKQIGLLALASFALFPEVGWSHPRAWPPSHAAHRLAGEIVLPNGWQPEGIAIGRDATIYAGSLATGAVFQADLRTGAGDVLVPPHPGRVAVGLKLDPRTNFLFVAGGATGAAYVYDADDGADVAAFQLSAATDRFINDVVVTRRAAYFTDSFRPVIYALPLGHGGAVAADAAVQEIALGGDFQFVAGQFNANGIEAADGGDTLIIVNSFLGTLYRVDAATGVAQLVDLGGATVANGDGILLLGRTLYVVQNMQNQVAVVRLGRRLTSGSVAATITDSRFDVPTTIDEFAGGLYLVNARFTTPPTPDTPYNIVRVPHRR
jgi:sugar lactone lactonase YvrE